MGTGGSITAAANTTMLLSGIFQNEYSFGNSWQPRASIIEKWRKRLSTSIIIVCLWLTDDYKLRAQRRLFLQNNKKKKICCHLGVKRLHLICSKTEIEKWGMGRNHWGVEESLRLVDVSHIDLDGVELFLETLSI